MSSWTWIHLESYCGFNWMKRKKWKAVDLDGKPAGEYENKGYVPASKRPYWCKTHNKKLIPQFRCMCYGKDEKRCPFFGYVEANKEDHELFEKAYAESLQNSDE